MWTFITGSAFNYQQAILESNRNIIRSFEDRSFSYKNDSYAYISRFKVFDEECDDCDALVHFFPGGYLSGTRYDHAPLMQYLAVTRKVQPWSIDYRLLDEGTSYVEVIEDAVQALTFLRKRIGPNRKIVVLGSSSGADLAMRVANRTDGVILDSAWFCLPTDFVDTVTSSVVKDSDAYKCFEETTVPTFVLHGEKDKIVSSTGAKEYVRRYPSVSSCFAEGAGHIVAFSDECNSELNAWLDASFGWKTVSSRQVFGTALITSYVTLNELNTRFISMLPSFILDIFVRRCQNVSPIEAYDNGCREVNTRQG